VSEHASLYCGHRFPREVIAHAVRLYLRFALSFRDVEELLAERGIQVSYETVRRWVAKFGAYYAEELRRREARLGRTWSLDEMATRVGRRVHRLWRAVDEHGQTLDVLLQARRDTAAAERFFWRLLAVAAGVAPARITTDKLGSYAAALARLPELAGAEHLRSTRRCGATTASSRRTNPPDCGSASCGGSGRRRPRNASSRRSRAWATCSAQAATASAQARTAPPCASGMRPGAM
jgi:putative transposase